MGGWRVSEQDDRQQEKDWRDSEPFDAKKYKNFYQLAGGVFITVVILLIGGFIYSNPSSGYWVNIYATIVGTILTIAVLDRRAEQRAVRERKEELVLQMGSKNNMFAVEAVRLLTLKGWLEDGSLRAAQLGGANLQDAQLSGANLQGAWLLNANLEHALMVLVNLQDAQLSGTNLQGAYLIGSNLQGAWLGETNLQDAHLSDADLRDAWLSNTNFSQKTFLPDGTNWSPERDMREFTDSSHPNFWQPEWVKYKQQSSHLASL